ncbi:MAG: hypothetical protein KKA30_20880 [Alphaproteobacteria bacterium]|nr:hypothetical protein [Alphaproteobacteria bacterium]MBU2306542.1 hypothetical protein [Alphaproteobacteria bacterium]
MSDLHHIAMNDGLIYGLSWVLLTLSVVISYVIFALKHSLASGYTMAAREQAEDFSEKWRREAGDGD